MENNNIYQTVLNSVLSLSIPAWDKLVFYAQYDEDSYEMKFYIKQNEAYKDCFSLGIPTKEIIDAFVKLDKDISKFRKQLSKGSQDLWNIMTIVFDSNMHFKTDFDYSEIEDIISYKSEWKKKYLKN